MKRRYRISEQIGDAMYEARKEAVPFTAWPLEPWILKKIKQRHSETGALCNQHL